MVRPVSLAGAEWPPLFQWKLRRDLQPTLRMQTPMLKSPGNPEELLHSHIRISTLTFFKCLIYVQQTLETKIHFQYGYISMSTSFWAPWWQADEDRTNLCTLQVFNTAVLLYLSIFSSLPNYFFHRSTWSQMFTCNYYFIFQVIVRFRSVKISVTVEGN